jgi:histo-blood group ABO system transferase
MTDSLASNGRISLIAIATGKYNEFVDALVAGAVKYVEGLDTVFVLSDHEQTHPRVTWLPWGHLGWPYPTLLRYRAITAYAQVIAERQSDLLLYVDVDMRFQHRLDLRDSDGTIAVRHPGFDGAPRERLPYETRVESRSYVDISEGEVYVAGGVQGGRTSAYLKACSAMAAMVQEDLSRGLIPVWHDESVWNRYCIDHPPDVLLTPQFCSPEEYQDAMAVIVALRKDHDRLRDVSTVNRLRRQMSQRRKRITALTRKAAKAALRR